MNKPPRAKCSICGYRQALTITGLIRTHYLWYGTKQGKCEGSLQEPAIAKHASIVMADRGDTR